MWIHQNHFMTISSILYSVILNMEYHGGGGSILLKESHLVHMVLKNQVYIFWAILTRLYNSYSGDPGSIN